MTGGVERGLMVPSAAQESSSRDGDGVTVPSARVGGYRGTSLIIKAKTVILAHDTESTTHSFG